MEYPATGRTTDAAIGGADSVRKQELDAVRASLQKKYPGTEIWYVPVTGPGRTIHTEWVMRLHADTPANLEEELRFAAMDAGMVAPDGETVQR